MFTDKLVAKIPSTHDGVIKSIKYKNDEICLVGRALIEIEVAEDATTPVAEPAKQEPVTAPACSGKPAAKTLSAA